MKSSSSIILLCLLPLSAWAFVTPISSTQQQRHELQLLGGVSSSSRPLLQRTPSSTILSAKKNKKKKRSSTSGEGFGKSASAVQDEPTTPAAIDDSATSSAPRALQSIESASSTPSSSPAADLNLDPNLSEEERSQEILRQKFGLKSYEEQQADLGDYKAVIDAEKKKVQRDKLRNIEALWPEDKDFFAVLPPGLVKGIDTFLKLGLGLSTVAFILAGVFITIEAGSKATGSELPGGLEEFVVNVVEPNFTPGLGVLLAFSISLGLFSVGLGGSASSTYREDP